MRDVGIVMPVYKQRKSYLRAAIRSILHQTYKNFKLVIVVDGAPSEIVRMIRREVGRDRRVRLIVKKENQGVAKALNRGFESLMHRKDIRYLTWVSSDNIYYPKFIEQLRKVIRRSPSRVGLVYSNFRHITPEGKNVFDHQARRQFRRWQRQSREQLLETCFVGPSFMYKRRIAEKAGRYRSELAPVDDYDYWLRLTDHCDLHYHPIELMAYRMNSDYSISAKLLKSHRKHQLWHYTFQLAKQTARLRRNIAVETTVIYPLSGVNEHVLKNFKTFLEQYYSNYHLLIIDPFVNSSASTSLLRHSDPRTTLINVSSGTESEAMRQVIRNADTSFVYIYGGEAINYHHLQILTAHLRDASSSVLSSSIDSSGSIHARSEIESEAPRSSTLYRTLPLQNNL